MVFRRGFAEHPYAFSGNAGCSCSRKHFLIPGFFDGPTCVFPKPFSGSLNCSVFLSPVNLHLHERGVLFGSSFSRGPRSDKYSRRHFGALFRVLVMDRLRGLSKVSLKSSTSSDSLRISRASHWSGLYWEGPQRSRFCTAESTASSRRSLFGFGCQPHVHIFLAYQKQRLSPVVICRRFHWGNGGNGRQVRAVHAPPD